MDAFAGSADGGVGPRLFVDGAPLSLEFGRKKPPAQVHGDWECDACRAVNFARRSRCYKCSQERPTRPRLVGDGHAATLLTPAPVRSDVEGRYDAAAPTATLVLYNLSKYSGEPEISEVMRAYAPVRDVKLLRDDIGQTIRVGFAQFHSVEAKVDTRYR